MSDEDEPVYKFEYDDKLEEECDTCNKGMDNIDINNAVDYLLEEQMIMVNWDDVRDDIVERDVETVEALLKNVYINVSDECLLNASKEVLRTVRKNKNQITDLEECWDVLIRTLSRTYTQCSPKFKENVQHNRR